MKKNLYFYTNLLAWGLVLFLIANYVFGWTTPSANPPDANLPAPINVSSTAQSKVGYLAIGTSTAPTIPLEVIGDGYFSGSVGIGTTGPGARLDVRTPGTIGSTYAFGNAGIIVTSASETLGIDDNQIAVSSNFYLDANTGSFHFRTGNPAVDKMTILNNGNVGIGTTSPFNGWIASPSGLHIEGVLPSLGLLNTDGGDRWLIHANATYGLSFWNDTDMEHRLSISNGGNVGIGTTAPSYDLDVSGNIRATGVIHADANGAMYFDGGDDVALYDINVANTMGIYGQQDSTIASIKLGSGGPVISGKGGNVGIGTTDPGYGLHVNKSSAKVGGNFASATFRIEATDTAGAPAYTAAIQIHGYEGRGKGIFLTDAGRVSS